LKPYPPGPPREIYVPAVGGTVRVRPVPRKLLADRATDANEAMVWKLVYGAEDPNFSEGQARAIARRFGLGVVQPIVDAIDHLSGTDGHLARVQGDPRVPRSVRSAMECGVMLSTLRRHSSSPVTSWSRGHERRQGCNQRSHGSRRSTGRNASRGSPSGDDPGESEPPGLNPYAAALARELSADSELRIARWRIEWAAHEPSFSLWGLA